MLKLLLFLLLLVPHIALASGNIELKELSRSEQESIYSLSASNITTDIIGISATILLKDHVTFTKFEQGTFWEKAGNTNVQYLISPKANDPRKVLLGIAALGNQQVGGSGEIAKLYFSHQQPPPPTPIISLDDTIVSGLKNGQRYDFPDISWHIIGTGLPESGPTFPLVLTLFIVTATCFFFCKHQIFKKYSKIWYNDMKNHKNQHVPTQKSHCD